MSRTTIDTTVKTYSKRCPRYQIELVRAGSGTYESYSRYGAITSADDACTVVASLTYDTLRNSPHEMLIAIALDTKYKPIGDFIVSSGVLDASLVHPREVFRGAIKLNAAAILLCHNHPSGDLTPSSEDHEVTRKIESAGKIVGITMLDHIIVGLDDETGVWRSTSLKQHMA